MLQRETILENARLADAITLNREELERLRGPLIAIAEAAGQFASEAQKELRIRRKSDNSPVTHADEEADRIIAAGLHRLTPSIPIVSEESVIPDPATLRGKSFWLVDPIDGTRGYAKGGPEWTVNIALIVDGLPVFGIVTQPALNEVYSGIVGVGSWKKKGAAEAAIAVRNLPEAGYAIVVSHRTGIDKAKESFAHLTISGIVSASSSLKFCRVAEGVADLYPRDLPTNEWDTGAGHAILKAAGGEVIDLTTGAPLAYTKPEWLNGHFLAVSNPAFDVGLLRGTK